MPALLRWILLLLLVFIASCDNAERKLFRIGANNWPGYASLYLAEQEGMFAGSDIHVIQLPSTSEVIHALRMGNLEAAALTLDEALTVIQDDLSLTVILIFDFSDGADALLAKPYIRSLAELKGHRVAVEATAVGAVMLNAALTDAGLNDGDIEIINCEYSQQLDCYEKYDAVVTFEPNKSILEDRGAVNLFNSSAIPGMIIDVLVVRSELLEQQMAQITQVQAAHFRAGQRLLNQTEDVYPQIKAIVGLSVADFKEALAGMHLPSAVESQKWLSQNNPPLLASARQLKELMLRNRLLRKEPDLSRLNPLPFVAGDTE